MKDKKLIYEINSYIELRQFKIIFKMFKRNYWGIVLKMIIIETIVISILTMLSKANFQYFILYDIIMIIFTMLFYKIAQNNIAENTYEKINKDKIEYKIYLYNEYLETKKENISEIFQYSDICKIIETDEDIYIKFKNKAIVINKCNCNAEELNFICNIDKEKYKIRKLMKTQKNITYHKWAKPLMNLLFVLTLICLFLAICTVIWLNTYYNTPLMIFYKHMWILWLWLPVPILSVVLGTRYGKYGIKNIKLGLIVTLLLLVFGFFSFIPTGETEYSEVKKYDTIINAKLPSCGTYIIRKYKNQYEYNKNMFNVIENKVYFYDGEEELHDFEQEIKNNQKWIKGNELNSPLKTFITDTQGQINYKYYLIYNQTTNQYNITPEESGDYNIYSLSYDTIGKILKIVECKFKYVK